MCDPCSCTGLHAQEHPLLGVKCFMVAVLKFKIILSFHLHFVSEANAMLEHGLGGSKPQSLGALAQSGVIPLLYLPTSRESIICLWRLPLGALASAWPFHPASLRLPPSGLRWWEMFAFCLYLPLLGGTWASVKGG